MEKSCNNCMFTGWGCTHCKSKTYCEHYEPGCESCKFENTGTPSGWEYNDTAYYLYEGQPYCAECLMKKLGIREKITYEYYDSEGRLLGNSKDYHIDEVFLHHTGVTSMEGQ